MMDRSETRPATASPMSALSSNASDKHVEALSASLLNLISTNKASLPLRLPELLRHLITSTPRTPGTRPAFRLTDQPVLERCLRTLARSWEHGSLFLQQDQAGELVLVDAQLGGSTRPVERKRKRVTEDDADSAAGSDADGSLGAEEELQFANYDGGPRLGQLSVELKEVYALLQRGTARAKLLAEEFRSEAPFEPICPHTTKSACINAKTALHPHASALPVPPACDLIHFRPIIRHHTDVTLGHCSYLNTCYSEPTYSLSPSIPPPPSSASHPRSAPGTFGHAGAPNANSPASLPSGLGAGGRGKEKAPCRYLHFEVDWDEADENQATAAAASAYKKINAKKEPKKPVKLGIGQGPSGKITELIPPQWINCDVRRFDYSVLGKFHVIMADPPWDIHMSLPYGTMTDDEMRAMPIPTLQDEGFLFLWVTGRAMEVGRECLRHWGYTRVDEVVWVKTNQLQRVIRTGRTGHWLNHTKEHMLVGLKTKVDEKGELIWPKWANRGLDTDVVVSEVRETSRKPDEVYALIERMCPGGRKIEIFGRKHNTRPGWLTLGNQLGQDQIHEEDLAERILARYPERAAQDKPTPGPPVGHGMATQGMSGQGMVAQMAPQRPMGPPTNVPVGLRHQHHLPMNPNRNMMVNMHMNKSNMGAGQGGMPRF